MSPAPLLEARGLAKRFPPRGRTPARARGEVRAVDGVDFEVAAGEFVGLVGESGCGKSTLARLLVRLLVPDAGTVRFDGRDLAELSPRDLRRLRRRFQIVFQDPYGSLNPRMTVGDLVAEPLVVHGLAPGREARRRRVAALLAEVGLEPGAADRYPHAFSGGQRQRIGIARAIACEPALLIADEPVSALDGPVQAQIVNLLLGLRESRGLAVVLVAHDLRLVSSVCDRVEVMYLGRIVEAGPAAVLDHPRHPYTRALARATPSIVPGSPRSPVPVGEPPSPDAIPGGCRFHPRCPDADAECVAIDPETAVHADGRRVACHHARDPGRPVPG